MIITQLQSNGLWIKQQSFRQCMEKLKWNCLLEEEGGSKDDKNKDHDNEDDEDSNDSNFDNNNNTAHQLKAQIQPGDGHAW